MDYHKLGSGAGGLKRIEIYSLVIREGRSSK